MTFLRIPQNDLTINEFSEIKDYLNKNNVFCEKWDITTSFSKDDDQDTILHAYEKLLKPFMEKNNYTTCDVVLVDDTTPNIDEVCEKFIQEHTHTDDEVRFIVEGSGTFWFNLGGDNPVFAVHSEPGFIISVPANTKHWFDMGDKPFVKAIRIFSDKQGWLAKYTESGVDRIYCYR